MTTVRVSRPSDKRIVADSCFVAESFWARFKGLMGKRAMADGSGLLLQPCNSIHTFFMNFPIDVIYLSRKFDREQRLYNVVSIKHAMKPWRMDLPVWGANAVLELPMGAAADLNQGDLLCLS